jgi:hypothetical protein
LKHSVQALVRQIRDVIPKESLGDCLAFCFAQAANHLPKEKDRHLHGAGTNLGSLDLAASHYA